MVFVSPQALEEKTLTLALFSNRKVAQAASC